MNTEMTVDEFHELLTVYIVQLSRETRGMLSDPNNTVFTPEFDDLLRYIQSKSLGKIKTVYMRESAATKLRYNRLKKSIKNANNIRLTVI